MVTFRCENCRQKIIARDAWAGRRVRCPRCRKPASVPAADVRVAPKTPSAMGELAPEAAGEVAAANGPVPALESPPASVQRPRQDFSTVFSAPLDALFEGGEHDYGPEELTRVLRPVHLPEEPHDAPPPPLEFPEPVDADLRNVIEPEPSAPRVVVEPAEIIDAPPAMRYGLNSANEVADLLRGLDNPAERARLAAASAAADGEARRLVAASSRPVRVLGWMSLVIGLATIALSSLPLTAKYAIAVGVGGLLLAMTGMIVAVGRRSRIGLPAGGVVTCAGGIGVALLWGFGLLPFNANSGARGATNMPVTLVADTQPAQRGGTPAEYVPANTPIVVNRLQVRILSVEVLRPAVYAGDPASLHTAFARQLQITIELKNLGDSRPIYLPWRRNREGAERVQLTGSHGVVLPLKELAVTDPSKPVVLAAGALHGPVAVGGFPVRDVLLFDPPANDGDLLLDLPGRNIGLPDSMLHIRIPRSMIRVQ